MAEEWYTNKELFEKIQDLAEEMQRTRDMLRRYNGLYETVQKHDCYIKEQQGRGKGMKSVETAFIKWGGWVIAIVGFGYAVLTWFGVV